MQHASGNTRFGVTKLCGFVFALAASCALGQGCPVVTYEPTTVTLRGKIAVATSRVSGGKRMTYPLLQLNSPVTVDSSGRTKPANTREECVAEIQLWAKDAKSMKRLLASKSKHVAVTGTLSRAHTEWHVRSVVMHVSGRPKNER